MKKNIFISNKTPIGCLLCTLLSAILFVVLCATGCGRSNTISTSTTTTEQTTSPTVKKTTIILYFGVDKEGAMYLIREERDIPQTPTVARAALEELIKGSKETGRISFIPKDSKVNMVRVDNSVATVDFSKEVLKANVGSEGEALGIAQIVNTLTEFPSIKKVRLTVEGRDKGAINGRNIEDWWGHIGLYDQPFSRNESVVQGNKISTNTIQIEEPQTYTQVENPLRIKGKAFVFEAQFNVRIIDKNDTRLVEKSVMSEGADWGPFDTTILYPAPKEPGIGKVLFFYYSPKDGREVTMGSVPVFLK